MAVIEGGCHCAAVRFRLTLLSSTVDLLDCNCSMCSRTGYLHLIVAHDHFELVSGRAQLSSYRFGTGAADHLFCAICGVKSFYQPRSHLDSWSINFRCLDEGHGLTPIMRAFDGRNWERARGALDGG
ncbi:MAG: GFA family protein [Pseudomonadota bacterium]